MNVAPIWMRGQVPPDYRPDAEAGIAACAMQTVETRRWEVLDVGCADGSFAKNLVEKTPLTLAAYSGFDVDPALRIRARARLKRVVSQIRVQPFADLAHWTPMGGAPVLVLFWNVLPYLEERSTLSVIRAIGRAAGGQRSAGAFLLLSAFAEECELPDLPEALAQFAAEKGASLNSGRKWILQESATRLQFGSLWIDGRPKVLTGNDVRDAYGLGAAGPFLRRVVVSGWVRGESGSEG